MSIPETYDVVQRLRFAAAVARERGVSLIVQEHGVHVSLTKAARSVSFLIDWDDIELARMNPLLPRIEQAAQVAR